MYVENGADVVFALDASSGKQLWTYNRQVTTNLAVRATTTPVVVGEQVIVGFSDGFAVSLKRRDGTLGWEQKLGKGTRFHDVDSTAVIDGENMYLASFDGTLASLKVASGAVNWTLDHGGYVPVTLGQGRWADRLYFATVAGDIIAVEKQTGKLLMTIKVAHGIATQPVLFNGELIYGESDGDFVVADSVLSGQTIARYDPGHGIMARPTIIDGSSDAYFMSGSGNLYALSLGYRRVEDRLPWQK